MKSQSVSVARFVLAASVSALLAHTAPADLIWDSAGPTDNWSTAFGDPNWQPGSTPWIQNENAIFNASSGAPEAIAVTTVNTFDNITFDVTGFSITSAGAGSLVLSSDLASTITVTNLADSASIAETIADNGAIASTLTKAGLGTLTLNGAAASTYSGGTIISAGTLAITQAGALGAGGVVNNATLNLIVGNSAPTGLSTSLGGAGIVNVSLPTGTGTTTLNGNYSGFTGTWNVGIGAGIGAGKVQMNGADNAAATINILSNATIYVSSTTAHNAALVLNGGDTGESLGQLRLDSGATWAGSVTLAGDVTGAGDGTIGSNTGTGTISGAIVETGGSRFLSKSGGGTIVLSGANSYTGKTLILNGSLSVSSLNRVAGGTLTSSLGAPTSVANGTLDIGSGGNGVQLIYTGAGETTDRVLNLAGMTGNVTLTQSGSGGNLKFTSDLTATGLGNKTVTLQGSTAATGEIAGAIVNSVGFNTGITKNGTGTWTLGGSNTYTGTTTVNQGVLRLDYSTNDNSKLADTNGPLVLGGGAIELSGGSHNEFVLSTTLAAGTNSTITRSSGAAVLQLNTITPNASTTLTLNGSGIASTDNTNTNGILGFWARTNVGGVWSWAQNSTNAADGLITAFTGYTDVSRFLDGAPAGTVPSDATKNVRIINGGTAGNITLGGGALTQAYTLQMSATDGGATIAPASTTSVLNIGNDAGGAIWQTANAGALTIGTAPNDGILTAGATANTAPANLRLINDSTNALTINSTIANNGSDVVSVTRTGNGTVVLAGNNSFTGLLTAAPGGTLILSGNNSARPNNVTGINTVNGGGILQAQANAGNTVAGVSTVLSSETVGAVQPLLVSNGGTLQLRADSSVTFAGGNNLGGVGSATVTFDVNQLTGAGTGNTLTIAPAGFNVNTTTINVTGGNGYTLNTGTITNVTGAAGATLTLNPTTASLSIGGYTGTTAFTSTLLLSGTSAGNVVTGPITNTTTATPSLISVTKSGTSTWNLAGANTYTGPTLVQDGTLIFSGNRTVSAGQITVSNAATSAGGATLNIQNGVFSLGGNSFFVGTAGTAGTVNHSAGIVSFTGGNQLLIGNGGTGTYNLSGGTLQSTAGAGVRLGVNANSVATFNLSGTGNLSESGASVQIGRSDSIGSFNTTNVFNQTGGIATIGTLGLGGNAGDANIASNISAALNLTGGTFTANAFSVLSAGGGNTSSILIGGTAVVTLPAFPTARGGGSTATITFDGGSLSPTAASANYMSGLTSALIKNGGAKFDVAASRDITVAQLLQNFAGNTGTFTKAGAGTLTLSNFDNSFSGTTTLTGGTLAIPTIADIGMNSPIGTGNATSAATNTASLVFNGGTLGFTGFSGTTNRGFTLAGAGAISFTTGNFKTLTFDGNVTGAGALTVNGQSGVGLQNVLTLNGNNSGFTGGVTAQVGGIKITNSTALGSGTKTITLINGTAGNSNLQLDGSGGNISLPSTFTYTVSNQTNNGTIVNVAGNNTIAGQINNTSGGGGFVATSLDGTLTISANVTAIAGARAIFLNGPADGTVSGVISNGATVDLPVAKSGTGTWTLSGANTFTGKTTAGEGTLSASSLNRVAGGSASSNLGAPTTVANGTIALGGGNAFALNPAATGTLRYTGAGETTDRVVDLAGSTGGGVLDQSGTGLLKFTSGFTATGVGSKTLTLQGSTSGTGEIAGVIADNSAPNPTSLTKTGTGTWTLSATNTYTGATAVDAGTLAFAASQTLSSLTIGDGAVVVLGAPAAPPAPEFADAALLDDALAGPEFAEAAMFDGGAVSAGAAAVPEPGSAALLLGGVLTLLGARRRRE